MSDQLTNFNSRIGRINNPKNTFYRDPETGINIPKRLSKKIIKANAAVMVQKAGPGAIMGSLLLGLLCLMAARYMRFNMAGIADAGTAAQTLTIMDAGLAAFLAFIVGSMIKHTSIRHMLAQCAGIALMLATMHNLVWFFPDEMAQVYTQAYVEQVRSLTAPQSIYVNGATIVAL